MNGDHGCLVPGAACCVRCEVPRARCVRGACREVRSSRQEEASGMAQREHAVIHSHKLPRPMGPYSPGITYEGLLFVSGQGATDPTTGRLAGLDVESQTEQALRNIASILEAAGSRLDCVLRCGVFLVDIRDFPAMNAVYERVFGRHRPARTTVGVASLPAHGLRVEIDAVAYVPKP